jgi:DNA-binding winged helix-turn-helix (wHTH) protein
MNPAAECTHHCEQSPISDADRAAAPGSLEFGRFRVLLHQRQLLADDAPVELGTRAFELLLALLEANGSLVTKQELIVRVWPGVVVTEENLKVQVSALRRALGENRNFIRTEFGRGYRFTAAVRSSAGRRSSQARTSRRYRSAEGSFPRRTRRRPSHGWFFQRHPTRARPVRGGSRSPRPTARRSRRFK